MERLSYVRVGEFVLMEGNLSQVIGKNDDCVVVTYKDGWVVSNHQTYIDRFNIPKRFHSKRALYHAMKDPCVKRLPTGQYADA